jgi:hypothetical protein
MSTLTHFPGARVPSQAQRAWSDRNRRASLDTPGLAALRSPLGMEVHRGTGSEA